MKNKISVKILSVIMSLAVLLSSVPVALASTDKTFSVATVSDIHYYPDSLSGNKGDAFYTYLRAANCVYDDLDAILDAALSSLEYEVKNNGVKNIVITGDLTTNGEYEGHVALSRKLLEFEKKTGANIYVTPGNHDINNDRASSFVNDVKEEAKRTTQAEFAELYKDLGFNEAYHRFSDYTAAKGGCLSYSVKTEDGYRLILADGGKFTSDVTEAEVDEQETAGAYTEELINWILAEAEDAEKKGEIPILFTHWNLSGMNYFHEYLMQGFVIDDHYILQETFADAGIHYAFSGHQHVSDVAITHSDSGEAMYSVVTPTLTQFPFSYRVTQFTRSGNKIDATFLQKSCDEYAGVQNIAGTGTYLTPYRKTGFCKQYGGRKADAADYIFNILKKTLDEYINKIRAEGSVVSFIEKEMDIDLADYFDNLLFGGIYIGDISLLSSENIMSCLSDLDAQIMDKFIWDRPYIYDVVKTALKNITSVKVSDVPCTYFLDTYGFGDSTKGGTVGDAVLSVLAHMYLGNEDISKDAFMTDFIKYCGTTDFLDTLIGAVKEYIVNDVVIDEILANINLRIDTLFVGSTVNVGKFFQTIYVILIAILDISKINTDQQADCSAALALLFSGTGDVSLKKLASTVLGTGLISYGTDFSSLIDTVLNMFITEDTKKTAVYQAQIVIGSMVQDDTKDHDVTYTYSGPEKVTPTEEEMELPVNVTLTPSDDSAHSFTVSWITKYSISASDIEVVKKNESFTGKAMTGDRIKVETENTTYTAPGYDAGTFSLLPWTRNVVSHKVTVSGLSPDTEYKYRIGDFTLGFTTEGTVKTAPEDDGKFTFIHTADLGGYTPDYFTAFSNTVKAAEKLYPSYAFNVITGGFTITSANDNQWSYAINSNKEMFRTKTTVYAADESDLGGNYTAKKYFAPETVPEQYMDSGLFYSYDYGDAHFIVLNTNAVTEGGSLSRQQTQWLREDLKNSTKMWDIIVMGGSVYCSDEASALRTQLLGLMEEYNIDLILQGGEAVYARTTLLKNDASVNANTKKVTVDSKEFTAYCNALGTVAVSSGGIGAITESTVPQSEIYASTRKTDNPVFSAITIDGDILAVSTYEVIGGTQTLIDSFAIEKADIEVKTGDINMDGKISAADARLALRCSVELETFSKTKFTIGDVNHDGVITAKDARHILRASVDLEVLIPIKIFVKAE